MERFLGHIVKDIEEKDLHLLHERCYVFPTKRACLVFKDLLSKSFQKQAFWGPSVFSIEDFVKGYTKRNTADELTLLFEMFNLYKKHEPDLGFDRFLPWGQVLLKDFDEVDKYLVDAKVLYEHILLYKEIEAGFDMGHEAMEAIRRFRNIINVSDKNRVVEAFVREWELVGKIYFEFNDILRRKNLSYTGMLYKELAENLGKGHYNPSFGHVYFCGFNALSLSEEEIFEKLLEANKATVYWDADNLYMNDLRLEAGSFLRKYKQRWNGGNSKWIVSDFFSSPKNIKIIGASKLLAQATTGSEEISSILEKGNGAADHQAALVLGDESLLLPVLYALPKQVSAVNVTMGYPLSKSAYIELIESLFDLHITKREDAPDCYFKTSTLLELIQNPYFVSDQKDFLRTFLSDTHLGYISFQKFSKHIKNEAVLNLFVALETPSGVLNVLIGFFTYLFDHFKNTPDLSLKQIDDEQTAFSFEKEVLYHLVKQCRAFQDKIGQYKFDLDLKTLKKLLRAALQVQKIPFAGEPLSGLQIMGLLETRTLDFERLVLLSVNEGNIPAGRSVNSFIPYSLKKAYKMPTFEEQDAIYAYHFFRLIQRASDITLVYNSDEDGGEKSRFLLQLEYLFNGLKSQGHRLEELIFTGLADKKTFQEPVFEISKEGLVCESLNRYNQGSVGLTKATFSPTALTSYITCPLQFYYKYIAGLKEQTEYVEELNAMEFGKILHRALELVYEPFVGKIVDERLIRNILAGGTLKGLLGTALEEQSFIEGKQKLEGKNKLLVKVIEKLAEKVLLDDIKAAPFKIIALEGDNYTCDLELGDAKVKLGGTIDRVDEVMGQENYIRIIDYKTGKTDFKPYTKASKQGLEDYFMDYFKESKYKAPFQAYYYAYLYRRKYVQGAKDVRPGILGLKEVSKGVQFMGKLPFFNEEAFNAFEKGLKKLLREIFDVRIPFTQTEDKRKCEFCSYKEICN